MCGLGLNVLLLSQGRLGEDAVPDVEGERAAAAFFAEGGAVVVGGGGGDGGGEFGGVIVLLRPDFREPLMKVFTKEPEAVAAGSAIFVCVAIYQVFDAGFITFSHALRGAGDTLWPTLVMLASGVFVLVGGSYYLVSFHPELKSLGPWVATTAHATVLGSAFFARWLFGPWTRIRLFCDIGLTP